MLEGSKYTVVYVIMLKNILAIFILDSNFTTLFSFSFLLYIPYFFFKKYHTMYDVYNYNSMTYEVYNFNHTRLQLYNRTTYYVCNYTKINVMNKIFVFFPFLFFYILTSQTYYLTLLFISIFSHLVCFTFTHPQSTCCAYLIPFQIDS